MSTDKERFTVTFDRDVLDKLEHYWRVNNFKNRNQAINELLRQVLTGPVVMSNDERRIVNAYRKSERIAQEMIKSALDAGNHYASSHLSHRAPSSSLGNAEPAPLFEKVGDEIIYTETDGELVTRIHEKIDQSPPDDGAQSVG